MKNSKCRPVLVFLILLLVSSLIPAQKNEAVPGLTLEQIMAIIDTASGEHALNHIRQLTLHHRWFVSDGYHQAALYIQKRAKEYGLNKVGIETFPADGKIHYATDKSYPKWTVRSARLALVSPNQKHLVSWAENPITLATYSRTADVTAELIDVGKGTDPSDYEGKDVKGKIVLASSPQGEGRIDFVQRLAVMERGAAGVISYRSYYLDDFPDLITWDHIFTHEFNGKQSTFGFCIPKRMGWELQRLLKERKKVVLRAEVDADISPGEYEVVKACIPGTDLADQEIWFTAHLDHTLPSANDNASGSAAILETARTLRTLIDSGLLPKPRRTIRFFWVPEICGTYAYVAKHLEETNKAVAVINMDMVGESQTLCGSVFRITQTPDSTPSCFNDILAMNLEFLLSHEYRPGRELTDPLLVVSLTGSRESWNARMIPYSGGSDHYVFMGGVVNIPATMFGSWPDYFYHSSGDTPDKSDPTQLKRAVVLGSMVAGSMANLNTQSGLELVTRIFTRSKKRLDDSSIKAQVLLKNSELTGKDLKEALNILQWTIVREKKTMQFLSRLLPEENLIDTEINKYTKYIDLQSGSLERTIRDEYADLCRKKQKKPQSFAPTEEEKSVKGLIPIRNPAFPGPISWEYLAEKIEDTSILDFPFTGLQVYEIGAFIDGKRSVADIRNAVSAECGPVKIRDVLAYLKVLEKAGLVTFK
ncbi:MAG: DUF4910 domain-containing protein [Candidatus Aminicenantes bacterium]|nr:DUF4910 domain-containing protein [Candidatus Aminicenantes bacterium]